MKLSEKIKRTITGKDRMEEGAIELQQVSNRLMADAGKRLLSDYEKGALKALLSHNSEGITSISEDFSTLANITGEIKSIHHQSVLLHGERILHAQQLFKKYGEYAFSRWLKTVYGNRQTPYNFLKYYQFYVSLSSALQQKVLSMPKQIIYTIASRNCSEKDKQRVIESYEGESKDTYIKAIRKAFPLEKKDRREKKKEKTSAQILYLLNAAIEATDSFKSELSLEELREIDFKLKEFSSILWQD